jgi:hypothetical protein
MIAASNGSTEILKAMGRGPSLLDLKDADGGTAAMTAAVHKHSSVLDFVSDFPAMHSTSSRLPSPPDEPSTPQSSTSLIMTNAPIASYRRSRPAKSESADFYGFFVRPFS